MQILRHHPDLPDEARAIASAVLDTVRAYFAHAPTVLAVLNSVDDPDEDAAREQP
jgi:hypothetical protein